MSHYAQPVLDAKNAGILERRKAALDARRAARGPVVGDFVAFADGVSRRITHIWDDSVQTGNGQFHLGEGSISFSGSLFPGVPPETLSATGRTLPGHAWFFDGHRIPCGDSGIDVHVDFHVWACSAPAPR